MGYYSTLYYDCTLADLTKLRGLFTEIKMKIASGIAEDWEHELDLLSVDEAGELFCDECNAKWYYDQKWIIHLAKYLKEGDVEFIGEDSERWGYMVENGKAYVCNYEKTKGEELTE